MQVIIRDSWEEALQELGVTESPENYTKQYPKTQMFWQLTRKGCECIDAEIVRNKLVQAIADDLSTVHLKQEKLVAYVDIKSYDGGRWKVEFGFLTGNVQESKETECLNAGVFKKSLAVLDEVKAVDEKFGKEDKV